MQRSFLLFSNAIHEKTTRDHYTLCLNKFMRFFKLKDYDSLAQMDPKMLQTMVEDFVMQKKAEGLSQQGIKNYTSPLEVFCDTNDLILNWKKIKRLYPPVGKRTGTKPYTTKQIRLMLEHEKSPRNKAIIHAIASSGMRVGGFEDLKLKHIVDFKEGCKKVTVYADTKYEYITFWTPEASKCFDFYLDMRKKDGEHLTPESPAFRTKYLLGSVNVRILKISAIQHVIKRALERVGLRSSDTKINGRYEIMQDHGFRKRWNTILKNTDGMKIISAEKMTGHSIPSNPLDEVYNIPEDEKLFNEYRKAIPELTIDDSARKQAELEKERTEKTELEKKINEIKELKQKMESFDKLKQELREEFLDEIKNLKDQPDKDKSFNVTN